MEWYYYLPIIMVVIVAIAQAVQPTTEKWISQDLARKFYELGDLSGKNLNEIENKVGKVTFKQRSHDGIICSWDTQNYNISILFDHNENFMSILEEQEISSSTYY